MTISTSEARNEYTANAGQTIFNYTFKIFDDTDLNVYITPSGQDANDSTDLTTDYTITGAGNDSGGTIVLTSGANLNDLVTIVSDVPSSRTTDYQNNGDFLPGPVNEDFDRVISITKKIEDVVNRTVVLPQSQQGPKPLTLPTPTAGQAVRWNGDGSGLENFDASASYSSEEIAADKVVVNHSTLASAVADTSLVLNQACNIKERTTGNGGGAVWDVVLASSVTVNEVNIVSCTGAPTLALVRRESANITPKISFVFDDAWNSTLGDLKTLFDARGYKFAAAIPLGSLGNSNRLEINDVPKLQQAGFEVINHNVSGDVANTTSYGQAKIRAEVQTCNSALNAVGVNPVGFQAPSSVMSDEYIDEVSRVCPFAFTQESSLLPITKGQNPLRLHRYSIESNTEQACSDAVDLVASIGGTIVFYAHDVATSDAQYDKIVAIIDRAEELGVVDIVSVSESIKSVTSVPQKPQTWFSGDLIGNDPNGFTASGDSSISVGNVSDITITANVIQQTLVQETFNLPSDITNGDLITFSCALRYISGSFGTNNSIGIQLKDAGDVVLYSDEISGGTLNTSYSRYNISAAKVNGAVKATVFMRVDAASAGAVALMRNPVLRFGDDVNPEVFTSDSMSITTSIIPAQTIAHSSQQTLTLTDEVDNGRYKIESNQLIITSDWEGSLHGTLSGVQQGTSGGYIAWSLGGGGGGSVAITTLNTNNGTSYGCSSIAGKFIKGASFTLVCQPYAVDFNVSGSLARITSLGG